MKNESERAEVIQKYEEYILARPDLLMDLPELEGKILGCYCHNDEPNHKMCHGDILRKLYASQIYNS